jgi:acetyltransferase-like isoleucine patch superfamily enzyme
MYFPKIPFYQLLIATNKLVFMKYYIFYNLFKVRTFGACLNVGKNPRLSNKFYLRIARNSIVVIGDDFVLSSGDNLNPLSRNIRCSISTSDGGEIIIGDNVKVSSTCIWSHKKIIIGNNVQIGADCIILDSDCHSLNYLDRKDSINDTLNKCSRTIIIEDDVLIGTRSIVLKGVRIGARTIIGAGSIVVNDIPEDCIATGNPCRVIKKLTKLI